MKSVSKGNGAGKLRKRHLTEREIWEIGAKRHLTKYPDLALMKERLARKAKAEPKYRFYNLYRWVLHDQTMQCAWERVKVKGGGPGVDGMTFQMMERSEGGAEAFIKRIQKELHEKTYRVSPLKRKYIPKACGQVMLIVRYADDFVILARKWADGFLQKVEGILEGRASGGIA